MQFSDSSTNLGLVQDVLFRTNTDVNQYPLKDITRYINEAYSNVVDIIIKSDGRMQWDDTNHTDQPISQFDLVTDQKFYEIFSSAPTVLQDWLQIDRIEIKDSTGNWYLLSQVDKRNMDRAISEVQEVSGTPLEFDFNGSELYLFPPANYSSVAGARIYFNRAPSYFASTDTTKRPGFATIFHPYLSMYAANQWNIIKKGDGSLQPLLEKMEKAIGKFYNKRNKSEVQLLRRMRESFK